MAAKRKPARKSAKTKKACERAGGKPVHFKGMKKGEVICFPKTSKKKKAGAKKGKRKQTAKQRAASMRNLKKARAARRK